MVYIWLYLRAAHSTQVLHEDVSSDSSPVQAPKPRRTLKGQAVLNQSWLLVGMSHPVQVVQVKPCPSFALSPLQDPVQEQQRRAGAQHARGAAEGRRTA